MKQPFFSIIVPTYNRKSFLEQCITSVLKQSYQDFEIIIIDDGSNDSTDQFIKSLSDDRILYKYQKNHGVAHARNQGISLSQGKYIAFLDSDDWWNPKKLERTDLYIKEHPDIKIFHTEEIWYKNGKLLLQKPKHKKPTGMVYKNALPLCCISISTAVIHKSIFDLVGIFDENLEACEDYEFWLRATSKCEVFLIPEALTLKNGGRPDQLSSKIWGLDRFRIKALEKMLGSNLLSKKNYDLTLKEFRKKCAIFSKGAQKHGSQDKALYYSKLPEKYQ